MKAVLGVAALLLGLTGGASAEDKEAKAVIDRAIKALGGEDALARADVISWKSKGKIYLEGTPNGFTLRTTLKGLDRTRAEFGGDFDGSDIEVITVLDGAKGWRRFNGTTLELTEHELAGERQNAYLQAISITMLAMKGDGFKVESKGEEKIDGKPSAVLKATGPDGKDFTLFFDKETGLPVKRTARIVNYDGNIVDDQTTFEGHQEFGGIMFATRGTSTRDGIKFAEVVNTEIKVQAKADTSVFSRPD
ncbi:hypothetical protein EP7_000692 [Isosphaeraceae bacterium EP7]